VRAYAQESCREHIMSSITSSLNIEQIVCNHIKNLEKENGDTSNPRIAPYMVLAYKDRQILLQLQYPCAQKSKAEQIF
jgi:hypothetical protein